jgi:cell division septum initiation protein DivIVA
MIKVNLKLFDGNGQPKPATTPVKAAEKEAKAPVQAPAQAPAQAPIVDLDAVQKKIDDMLAKAQKAAEVIFAGAQEKADEIVNDASEKMKAAAPVPVDPSQEAKEKAEFERYMNELVPVYLFKDNNKYRDDVSVIVNGESILIQRGKHVSIKRKFAEALDNSQMQDAFAADHMTALEQQYKDKEPRLS